MNDRKRYVNLAISPLYRDFVISKPCFIHIDFGEHLFYVKCDQTVYGVPYDDTLSQFAVGESFVIRNKVDPKVTYTFYEGFNAGIESKFAIKISENKVFKKQPNGDWQEVNLP